MTYYLSIRADELQKREMLMAIGENGTDDAEVVLDPELEDQDYAIGNGSSGIIRIRVREMTIQNIRAALAEVTRTSPQALILQYIH